ncbi:MAG TPA: (5-formylfuran-3-yl)methyl phosphate synthase [Pseudolabrys sp.]|nr:(5-formylfuran-3-yl)methyl phosphate synthase [Pseudolabrys sp.]
MTQLLASVVDAGEAEVALAGGADIIDLKDPARGALGALESDAVRLIVTAVAGRRPLSAVTGDLPMEPEVVTAAAAAMAETGVDYVKVGLFPGARRADCIRALAPLAPRTKLIGVMFADAEPDAGLIPLMAECGFAGAMLDTAHKRSGRLLDHAGLDRLDAFVRACRSHNLLAGLAGSLEAPDVPRLLLLSPDYLGFRGALCAAHDRTAGLDGGAVELIRALIPRDFNNAIVQLSTPPQRPPRADVHILAARGYSADSARERGEVDRVFVHDLVLPLQVGAYGHERERTQTVRFNVDAEVARVPRAVQDMRDVLSYDVITDGIRLITADGHVALVETLAERIAAFVLDHARVQRVRVRVEKLDVGPGHVGVEIERQRPAEVAKVYQLYPTAAGTGGPGSGN